ncbi:MAG: helix-turn-helix domain-containing protein [Paludibacter sp.]|nr:helix-turn-helix domain-containing protein [Paludibacter sp.]
MVHPDVILEQVAKNFFVKKADIISAKKDRNSSEARFFFVKLTRELNKMTFKEIGLKINRKASSIITAQNRANQLIEIYPEMKTLYNKLRDEITME